MARGRIYWLWRLSSFIRLPIMLNSLAGVVQVCASLMFIWECKQLIDIATHARKGNIVFHAIVLVSLVLVQLAMTAWRTYIENVNEIQIKNALQRHIFAKILMSVWSGKDKLHSGDAISRLSEDVRVIGEILCKTIHTIIVASFQLVAAFAFLSILNRTLALIIFSIMPVFLLFSKLYFRKVRSLTGTIRSADSRIQSHLQENIQHKILIKTLGQSKGVTTKLGMLQKELSQAVYKRTNFTLFSRTLISVGFSLGYVIAFLWGVVGIYKGLMTLGVMTAFLQLVSQVQRPIVDLSGYFNTFGNSLASVDRLRELGYAPLEKQGPDIMLEGEVGVRMVDVSFAYPDSERKVIENASYRFAPGTRTAIMGETGSGKSTLIRLMLSLLQSQSGKITVFNKDSEIEASSLTRCNFSYVPQGNTLLSGTIRENLLLARPDASDNDIRMALETAVAEFVYNLEEGIDTICSERGGGLSEGQAQRICIARGLLHPGKILLLDEFSASLDVDTELKLIDRLLARTEGRTLIFITHRLPIINHCRQIIKLRKQL